MNKIIEIINALNKQNESWRDYFEEEDMFFTRLRNDSYVDNTKKLIQQMISEILNKQKQLIDAHKEEEEDGLWDEIEELSGSEKVKDAIQECNDDVIDIYRNVRPLREAQDSIIPIIIAAFEHLSVSYAPDFFQMGEKYGIASENDFIPAVLQLDRIVSVHVRRHYDRQTAYKEFIKATGLAHEYALIYAELYERHIERLQHNICIDQLDSLALRVDKLTREVHRLSEKIQK